MLKDIKLGMKLLRYSYGFKTNIAFMMFFLLIGGVMMALPKVEAFIFGGIYIFIGFFLFIQMNYVLMCAKAVSAAPHRKLFEQTLPDMLLFISAVLWYLVLTVLAAVFIKCRPTLQGEYSASLVVLAIFIAVMLLYVGICYKSFCVSVILMGIGIFYMFIMGREIVTVFMLKYVGIDLFAYFVIGLVIVIVASLMSALLRKIFYKRPMSEMAMGAIVRQAVKKV